MRYITSIYLLFIGLAAAAQAPLTYARVLGSLDCAQADIKAQIELPGAQEPVVYDIHIESTNAAATDTLSRSNYLIDWTLHRSGDNSKGFAAYFDGTHIRWRDTRMQEYYAAQDVRPFTSSKPVHKTVQFADLLPENLSAALKEMATDSAWSWQVFKRPAYVRIDATQRLQGYDVMTVEMTFDTKTQLPLSVSRVYNPGGISEQEVTYKYTWLNSPCHAINEQYLTELYNDAFERFRSNSFKAESLKGQPLPAYALNDADGVRHKHRRGEHLDHPSIYVFIDPQTVTASQTISDVRGAMQSLPVSVDVYWLTPAGTNMITPEFGETILPKAKSMIVDCGISSYPTLIFVNSNGTVAQVHIGQNNNMADVVTQQTLTLN